MKSFCAVTQNTAAKLGSASDFLIRRRRRVWWVSCCTREATVSLPFHDKHWGGDRLDYVFPPNVHLQISIILEVCMHSDKKRQMTNFIAFLPPCCSSCGTGPTYSSCSPCQRYLRPSVCLHFSGKSNNASPEARVSASLLAVITIPDVSMAIAAAKTNEDPELTC